MLQGVKTNNNSQEGGYLKRPDLIIKELTRQRAGFLYCGRHIAGQKVEIVKK